MRIAVIGTGVSGLACAHLLHHDHDLTVYEAKDYVGGHTCTVDVDRPGGPVAVDTGFIVFNEVNYPRFCRLLEQLDVTSHESNMSFGVRCDRTGLEYRGSSLNTLFAQRRNLLRPSFHRLVRDIFRFFREAPALMDAEAHEDSAKITLGEYLRENRYSREFTEQHILPMGAALWSATPDKVEDFPARFVVAFLHHHRMLQVRGRPRWRVITGGSQRYVERLIAPFTDRIRLRTPVICVERLARPDHREDSAHSSPPEHSAGPAPPKHSTRPDHRDRQSQTRRDARIRLTTADGEQATYDHVIVATHSDQALAMLASPTRIERGVLGSLPYQENEVLLHTDATVMPRTGRAWASWNCHIPQEHRLRVSVTYYMNRLQRLSGEPDYFVTLNPGDRLDERHVIRRMTYHHPVYTTEGFAAQQRRAELIDHDGVSYCGAYWGYGFHEDGLRSALEVTQTFGKDLES